MDLELLGELKDRFGLSRMSTPALVGIVAVLIVVAVVAAGRLIGTATANEFEVTRTPDGAGQLASAQAEPAEETTLFVHVSGSVGAPGLYEVDGGARVADAVQAAGGFADDADTGSVNLARPLEDGEQIVVAAQGAEGASPSGSGGDASATSAPTGPSASSGLVNINTASAAELESLPGIGEATAAKIVGDRQANGSFKSIEDLKRVSGIGDKKFEALSGLICV